MVSTIQSNSSFFLQVDLKIELSLTGMVIRGHNGRWLKQFRLQYSKDGLTWVYYNENGGDSPVCTISKC